MKEKKPTTESFDQWEAWAQRTYRTGGTQPPKSHGGLIAFLLVLIIFLSGISTALGLMNIRLSQQISTLLPPQEPSPVAFSTTPQREEEIFDSPLGFIGQEVTDFWQSYHHLPKGIYVTEVIEDSDAFLKGILPGDILTHIDDIPVPDQETLQQLLDSYASGDSVSIEIFRDEETLSITLILE